VRTPVPPDLVVILREPPAQARRLQTFDKRE
jgi:hypothetical protein